METTLATKKRDSCRKGRFENKAFDKRAVILVEPWHLELLGERPCLAVIYDRTIMSLRSEVCPSFSLNLLPQ